MRLAWLSGVLLLGVVFSACSSSSGGSSSSGLPDGCTDYTPPADFVAMTPATSFSKDVMPIFQSSCAFSTCHGSTGTVNNGVFLGSDAKKVYAGLVNVRAGELQAMPFVTAGDPRSSYLMRKMDASQCALDAMCTDGSCQGSMPKNGDSLDVGTRDIVRRWIAQGAKND